MNLKRIGYEDVDWILQARDGIQRRVLVKRVKTLPVVERREHISRDEGLLDP
jgi:hypothetical protein